MSQAVDPGGELGHPRLGALSTAVLRLSSAYGRSPAGATSWRVGDNCVVTALEDFMTPGERELIDRGDARLVRQLRSAFVVAVGDEYVRIAEGALGQEVIAHHSQLICASRMCLDTLVLGGARRLSAGPAIAAIGHAQA